MSDSTKTQSGAGKWLLIALWSAQVLLAVAFGMFGLMKLTTPIAQLAKNLPWVADYALLIRFIGLSEVAGAIGLLLPAVTRIAPVLTPIAASGLVVIMVLAFAFHVARGEFSGLPFVTALGAIAAFVAWGRFGRAAISARGTAPATLRSVTD
ncbi:MAG: DoxX protein [Acidobacteria bacterium]|nr:DoxX protein [Acidobacteriota bacterium]